jgi:hypothetical protein
MQTITALVERKAPPIVRPKREKRKVYEGLFGEIRDAAGEWLAIAPEAITGSTVTRRQANICQAAAIRGFVIQTTVQEGTLYVRFVREAANA